jgi:hypothetical protein
MSSPQLDEWGHIETRKFPDGSCGGVMERKREGMGARLVWSRDGNPSNGYDRVWWYEDIPAALKALKAWKYPKAPTGFGRDTNKEPVDITEDI